MNNFENDNTPASIANIVRELIENRFDPRKELPERPEFKYTITHNGQEYGMGTRGSIIQVSGQSKTRKSTLMAMFAAASIANTRECMHIRANYPYDSGMYYWFDTEQTVEEFEYFQRMVWRLSRRDTKKGPGRYVAIHLRPFDEDTRYAIVDHIMTGAKGRIAAVFMDGIADFVMNANEQEASRSLVTRVSQWADHHGFPLFTAIHTNKDGKDSTGSLGGFLDKKCSVHLRTEVSSEDGPTRVTFRLNRAGGRVPPFEFVHGPDGVPIMLNILGAFGDDAMDNESDGDESSKTAY